MQHSHISDNDCMQALREWQAFIDCKSTIDNYLEELPLFQALAVKAMRPRYILPSTSQAAAPCIEALRTPHLIHNCLCEFLSRLCRTSCCKSLSACISVQASKTSSKVQVQMAELVSVRATSVVEGALTSSALTIYFVQHSLVQAWFT